ncbi:putative uridine kinase DAS2 [Ascoidea rubescens DSM 1968]|uniref:p-loop containing nucleoside triphosphate hydrolase protein n=1 Tax=Ascoidea rubescens DSM 1968 TaxID=1344418 RepID=A0A1D2VI87_9ASCO|nr:P-loop containing nucleoside triphosphate hydrolase protein [Ascoidea rubescens DSM 1968]ODV61362.1 P-loop containing nucleoside triphosphate hydrolase protein [Ascoidea rubescens DSM 1968]
MTLNRTSATKPSIVLVAGGHASGKRTVCNLLRKELLSRVQKIRSLRKHGTNLIEIVDMDDYLRDSKDSGNSSHSTVKCFTDFRHSINKEKLAPETRSTLQKNLENKNLAPSRFDFDKLKNDLLDDYKQRNHPLLYLVHGLYALYDAELRKFSDFNIFIDCDADTRLTRWINEDIIENEQSDIRLQDILDYYLNYARPEMNQFINPTKQFSDIILTRSSDTCSISILCDGIFSVLSKKLTEYDNSSQTDSEKPNSNLSLFPYNRISISSTKIIEDYRHSTDKNSIIQQKKYDLDREDLDARVQRYYDLN